MRLLAAQVPALARRAVQVPTKMLGTIELDAAPGANTIRVRIDGADAPIDVLNATGRALAAAQRVVVDFYPPHGAVVSGVLAPALALEQWFTTGAFSVAPSSTVSVAPSAWTEADTNGTGWDIDGDELVCRTAGVWTCALQAEWTSSGGGTHRAAAMLDQDGVHRARTTHQFNAPGGTPTSGYGLSGGGFGMPYEVEVGDTLGGRARQNAAGDLSVTLMVHLRLVGV